MCKKMQKTQLDGGFLTVNYDQGPTYKNENFIQTFVKNWLAVVV